MRNFKFLGVSFLLAITAATSGTAQNPIIQTKYTADPAPMVYNDTVFLYTTHDEDDARQGHQGREILRLEHVHKDALTLNAGEGENPSREGGSDVGPHDDADGLAQLHDTGVHEAHQHDGHGG